MRQIRTAGALAALRAAGRAPGRARPGVARFVAATLAAGVLTAWAVPAGAAAPIPRQTVVAAAGQVVRGDRYVAGDTILVDGTVDGDLFAVGNRVLVRGRVNGDVIGAGETLHVTGEVGGDVRFLGQSLTVDGAVGGGLTASAAQRVWISREGRVGRTLLALAEGVIVDGRVGGDVRAATQRLVVSGRVGRDVQARADEVEALEGGEIGGTLEVWAATPPTVDARARVGSTRFHALEPQPRNLVSTFEALSFVGFVAFAGIVGWLWPGFGPRARRTLESHAGAAFGGGVALLFGVPALFVLMLVSGIGVAPALLVVGPGYLAALYLGQVALARAVAAWGVERFRLSGRLARGGALAGAALLGFIGVRLPLLGPLIGFALACLGLGLLAAMWRAPGGPAAPASSEF